MAIVHLAILVHFFIFTLIKVSNPMNRENIDKALITQLRQKYEDSKNRLWHVTSQIRQYKDDKQVADRNIRTLNQNLLKLKKENEKLRQEVESLKTKNSRNVSDDHDHDKGAFVVRKTWDQVTDPGTKCKRRKIYKSILDKSVSRISECRHAKITLGFKNSHADIVWTEKDMEISRKNWGIKESKYNFSKIKTIQKPKCKLHDLKRVKRLGNLKSNDGIFTDNCRYSSNHIRKVISVMDESRISQTAYQKLKNVCQGHMPSLSDIKYEKQLMSFQLPITAHERVIVFVHYTIVFRF